MNLLETQWIKTLVNNVILASIVFVNFSSFAASLQQADSYFNKHQYELALNEYLSVADSKAPKVYYQLGVIHYKGLGTEADSFKALIWFSMAAEQNYDNSVEIVDNLIANVQAEEKSQVMQLIKTSKTSYAKQAIFRKHLPELGEDNLKQRMKFGDYDDISEVEIYSDEGFNDSLFMSNGSNEIDYLDGNADSAYSTEDNLFQSAPFFLIADYDIAPDGSIRNITQVKSSGIVESAEYDLSLNSLPKPTFNDEEVHFINRSYLGIAQFNRYRMRREYYTFYKNVKRLTDTLSKSDLIKDQYSYGMALMNFPWLTQENGDVDRLLKGAAENGYTLAKYEYGLKLYREQKDPKQAIHWITQAAKNEHVQAQYRIARILLDSPWVIQDEKKALFWLQEAANAGHVYAKQKSAEVKLLTRHEELFDITGAIAYLSDISEQQNEDPQYQYLQAIAHAKMKTRNLPRAVKYIRSAIKSGKSLNWDVTLWQAQLKRWTSGGSVTIQEL